MEIDSENAYNFKARACVVCATRILQDANDNAVENKSGVKEKSAKISPIVFLKGMLVLCKALSMEGKYAKEEKWILPGGDVNFVKIVCCKGCYSLFENLVKLDELIESTKVSLIQVMLIDITLKNYG